MIYPCIIVISHSYVGWPEGKDRDVHSFLYAAWWFWSLDFPAKILGDWGCVYSDWESGVFLKRAAWRSVEPEVGDFSALKLDVEHGLARKT